VEISDGGIIKCNYELCVKVVSKSNIQSKTPVYSHSYYATIFTAVRIRECRLLTDVCREGEDSVFLRNVRM
jgi:hypothetical protein